MTVSSYITDFFLSNYITSYFQRAVKHKIIKVLRVIILTIFCVQINYLRHELTNSSRIKTVLFNCQMCRSTPKFRHKNKFYDGY